MVTHAAEILKIARNQLGLSEEPPGSNDGKALRAFLSETQFQPGDPWCMFFIIAVLADAFGGVLKIPDYIDQTGSASRMAHTAAVQGKLSRNPATGCIFLLPGGPTGWRHGGFVHTIDFQHRIIRTYEGNSNEHGGAEGTQVVSHTRGLDMCRYINF